MEKLTQVFAMIGYYTIAAAYFIANFVTYSIISFGLVDCLAMRFVYRSKRLSSNQQFCIGNWLMAISMIIVAALMVLFCARIFALVPLPDKPS